MTAVVASNRPICVLGPTIRRGGRRATRTPCTDLTVQNSGGEQRGSERAGVAVAR